VSEYGVGRVGIGGRSSGFGMGCLLERQGCGLWGLAAIVVAEVSRQGLVGVRLLLLREGKTAGLGGCELVEMVQSSEGNEKEARVEQAVISIACHHRSHCMNANRWYRLMA
jgi:hypothetical protein